MGRLQISSQPCGRHLQSWKPCVPPHDCSKAINFCSIIMDVSFAKDLEMLNSSPWKNTNRSTYNQYRLAWHFLFTFIFYKNEIDNATYWILCKLDEKISQSATLALSKEGWAYYASLGAWKRFSFATDSLGAFTAIIVTKGLYSSSTLFARTNIDIQWVLTLLEWGGDHLVVFGGNTWEHKVFLGGHYNREGKHYGPYYYVTF